jgi:hypothetical protein
MDELFDVVVSGEIDPNFSRKEVESNLKQLKGLPENQIARLISGRQVYVKKDAPEEKAQIFKNKLQALGLITQIQPVSLRVANQAASTAKPPTAEIPAYTPPVKPVETPQPHIVYIEKPTSAANGLSNRNPLSYLILLFTGFFWFGVGLATMLAFSPFPDGVIRRGMLLGLLFFGIGGYRMIKRSRSA